MLRRGATLCRRLLRHRRLTDRSMDWTPAPAPSLPALTRRARRAKSLSCDGLISEKIDSREIYPWQSDASYVLASCISHSSIQSDIKSIDLLNLLNYRLLHVVKTWPVLCYINSHIEILVSQVCLLTKRFYK